MQAVRLVPTTIAVVLLLSGCRGFGMSSLPGETEASPELEKKTLSMLMAKDEAVDEHCKQRRVVKREIISAGVRGSVEDWDLDRCGTLVRYRIEFRDDASGGTLIGI